MSLLRTLTETVVLPAGFLAFPWFLLFATKFRNAAFAGTITCLLSSLFPLLLGDYELFIGLLAASTTFCFAFRFKIVGAVFSQLVLMLAGLVYGFYYYLIVFPPINPNPINDTQCGCVLLVFTLFEAYFFFSLLCFVLASRLFSRR